MKKLRYIGLMIGFVILINTNSEAQYYYTSYGYAQDWYLPQYIHHTIYDNYYGFEIAHVNRYYKHGHQRFNVLLHRNGWFVELRMDHRGHIYKTIKHRHYNPLMTHHCTNHCGYHQVYYQTYYPTYHKHHHGYKKVVYVNSTQGNHHQHNNYYTNVYVEQKQNNARNNQKKVIRQPQRNADKKIHQSRPGSGSRIAQVSTGQNTSRGRTREVVVQRNGRSSRNR